jgi:3'-phosphoadenosine 5'-phosphosulfate sulfotransferase (PAPS reductase)/FAD synthetase
VEAIASSIERFGFVVPILYDVAGDRIVNGEGSWRAAQRVGMERVPVIPVDHLDGAEVKALRLAINQLTLSTDWDQDKLIAQLAELSDLDVDLKGLGFEPEELEKLLGVGEDPVEPGAELEPADLDEVVAAELAKVDRVVFEFSGGRDSCLAMVKTLPLIRDKRYEALFVDTGVEFPDLPLFVRDFCRSYDVPLKVLTPRESFIAYYDEKGKFPLPMIRDCQKKFINGALDEYMRKIDEPFIDVRGARSKQRTLISNSDILQEVDKGRGFTLRILNPIFTLTDEEHAAETAKLKLWKGYELGFERTACWCCPFQTKRQYEALRKLYPGLWETLRVLHGRWECFEGGTFDRYFNIRNA